MSEPITVNAAPSEPTSLYTPLLGAARAAAASSAPGGTAPRHETAEVDWPTVPGGLDKPADFANWPRKTERVRRRDLRAMRDVLVALAIAIVVAIAATLYITGAFSAGDERPPVAPTDPFEIAP